MSLKNIASSIKFAIREITEKPLRHLEDQTSTNIKDQKISPIVYQTWSDKYFGRTHFNSLKKFRSLNPDLSFKIYTDQDVDTYMESNWKNNDIYEIFKNSLIGPLKTDIFRYCILYDRGGYYFDISRGCKIPLNKLHNQDTSMIISYEDTECYIPPKDQKIFKLKRPFNHFLQWGLAFEKNHKFLELLLNEITNNYNFYKGKVFENPKLAILNFTGPGMYTHVMRNYLTKYGLNGVKELDVKFDGQGIFKIKGSQFRYHKIKSYTYLKNAKICD